MTPGEIALLIIIGFLIGFLVVLAVIWQIVRYWKGWQKCPVCRHETIERYASECPKCGYRLSDWKKLENGETTHSETMLSKNVIFEAVQHSPLSKPANPGSAGVIRIGDLSLTPIGLCFFQYAEKTIDKLTPFFLFGVVGAVFDNFGNALFKYKEEIAETIEEADDKRCSLEESSMQERFRKTKGSFFQRTEMIEGVDIEPIKALTIKVLGKHFWQKEALEYNALVRIRLQNGAILPFFLAGVDILQFKNRCSDLFKTDKKASASES